MNAGRKVGRRRFLQAGGLSIALPVLEAHRARPAQAAERRKRIIFFFTPNGTNRPGDFNPSTTGPAFELGPEVQPLAELRSHILWLTGINMASAKTDSGDLHSVGMSHLLTNTRWVVDSKFKKPGGLPAGYAGGISLDQHIARKLAGKPGHPALASLELGVQTIGELGVHPFSRMSYSGRNTPVPAEDDPRAIWARLFARPGAGDLPGTNAELETIRQQRKSVLDFVKEEYAVVAQSLGAADRRRIDHHFTTLRDLELRLSAPVSACASAVTQPAIDFRDPKRFADVARLQMDLLAAALACDMTRVATLQLSWARSTLPHPWAGVTEAHHTITHEGSNDKRLAVSKINRWFASQAAYLAGALAKLREGDHSVLDNSVIWWCSDVSLGLNHSFDNIRAVLIGSCGGYFKTGRHVKLGGEPHGKLLVTLQNAMGVPDTQFGDARFGTGRSQGCDFPSTAGAVLHLS